MKWTEVIKTLFSVFVYWLSCNGEKCYSIL